ncbi:DUF11 domain-containing protein [Polaromonas sp. YR568]|uniref:beta strand repeat-containing protein n=1 Tax=Polaromonas sp. YR568 TaxID=1855301 RepID=UPI000B841868|nr:DUF11 domain-containing protein [Polaromonas sp. YR568]
MPSKPASSRGLFRGARAARAAWGAAFLLLAAPWAMAQTTFNFTGALQTYTIPAGAGGIQIQAAGGGGGGAASDSPGAGGNGGRGTRATSIYYAAPGTVINVYVGGGGAEGYTSTGTHDCTNSAGAGGSAGGAGGIAGGKAGEAGCNGYSGGGGGGGGASVVATAANVALVIGGGGGGGQGGALNVAGRVGLNSLLTGTLPGSVGGVGTTTTDGGGGGGGGGGCPGGVGGAFNPDSTTPNNTTQAGGGRSCSNTGLGVATPTTAATGGLGGTGATANASPGTAGAAGSVTLTPLFPTLNITKSAPTPALRVGTNSTYTLTVTTSGTTPAYTARVFDQLPTNMTYVSGVGTGWTCSSAANAGGTLVTCDFVGTIAASGGTASVQITATPTSVTSVTNRASVGTGGNAPPTASTCTAANTPSAGCAAPVTNVPTIVTLGLVKSAPSPALKVGTNSAYTLTVTNTGTVATTTARVVDQLPANMTFVSATGTGWTCSTSGNTLVTCDYTGSIAATNGTSVITITATPTSVASVTNYASTDPRGGTATPTPTTCTAANTPSAGCAAPVTNTPTIVILGLVKSTPSPALQTGVNSAYTLTVTNTGTIATTTARVLDQLPANLTYVSGTGTGWTCSTAASGGGTLVTCNFAGTIAAGGGTSVLTITVAPTNTTTAITNYAAVDSDGGTAPPVPTTCTAANTPTDGCAAPVTSSVVLGLVKSAPSPALSVGINSAYTLTVTNSGNAAATTARVLDQLPANMTFVSATGTGWTCTPSGGTLVTCNFSGVIAPGGTAVITLTATPTSSASVTNYASVDPSGGTAPPTATTCTAANTPSAGCAAPVTNTPTAPVLGLVKSAPSPALQVFTNSAYTLTVTNSGTAAATTARILDQLPANLTYVSGTGTGWSCSAAGGGGALVTCNYSGSIAAGGGTSSVVITVTATSNAATTNYASVDPTGGTTPPTPTSCTAANTPSAGCAAPVTSTAGRGITGTVYADVNHNSSLEASETGIGGAIPLFVKLVPLSGGVCTGPAVASASVTLSTGAYSLSSVPEGSYCLVLDGNATPSDIAPAYPAGWIGTENPTGVIQLAVGAAPPSPKNFGLYNGSSLSGNVFADNGTGGGPNNGVKSASEPGLAAIAVNAMQGATTLDSEPTASDGTFILWIPASASGTVVITPVLPAGYTATGGSAGTTGGTYTRPSVSYTAGSGVTRTGISFGMVAPNTFGPNGAQTAQPGTVVTHAHTYKAGTGGQVSFSMLGTATPASPAWNQVLYQDSNCNAVLEASETQVPVPLTVTAGQTVCLIVKQFVPAGAGQGAQNSVAVSAAFTYTGSAPALAVSTLIVTDITTVGQAGDLDLTKLVSNVTQAIPAATSVNANPGDTLQYTLTATNNGTQPLSTLFVSDSTTAFTGFVSATCPGALPAGITACTVTTQPAVGAQGALKWTFTGSLASGAQLVVTYRVKVDQ